MMRASWLNGRGHEQGGGGRHDGDGHAGHVRRQAPGHEPEGLRDDGHGGQAEPVGESGRDPGAGASHPGEDDHEQRRRHGETEPGDEAAEHPRLTRSDGDAELAAGRARQRLAERHELAEGGVVKPAAPFDVFAPEVPDVGDGPPERGQAQAQRRDADFGGPRPEGASVTLRAVDGLHRP